MRIVQIGGVFTFLPPRFSGAGVNFQLCVLWFYPKHSKGIPAVRSIHDSYIFKSEMRRQQKS
jgi:hypothetical protein